MPLKKGGYILLSFTVLLALAISLIAYFYLYSTPFNLSLRLLALNGFLLLSVATILVPFLKETVSLFGASFLKIHHSFAAVGLALITLHPVVLSIQIMNLSVFIPSTSSLELFLANGGRPSLIIVYIAVVAALLRRSIPKYWRLFHVLIYLALFFGIVHANLVGTDVYGFDNLPIAIIYNVMFGAVLVAFGLKRVQQARLQQRRKAAMERQNQKGK
jgi:DMSO/TMAO reductase YedYZ heme-binding membrane subunit